MKNKYSLESIGEHKIKFGSNTLMGTSGDSYPLHSGNYFSLVDENGDSHNVVNITLEDLEKIMEINSIKKVEFLKILTPDGKYTNGVFISSKDIPQIWFVDKLRYYGLNINDEEIDIATKQFLKESKYLYKYDINKEKTDLEYLEEEIRNKLDPERVDMDNLKINFIDSEDTLIERNYKIKKDYSDTSNNKQFVTFLNHHQYIYFNDALNTHLHSKTIGELIIEDNKLIAINIFTDSKTLEMIKNGVKEMKSFKKFKNNLKVPTNDLIMELHDLKEKDNQRKIDDEMNGAYRLLEESYLEKIFNKYLTSKYSHILGDKPLKDVYKGTLDILKAEVNEFVVNIKNIHDKDETATVTVEEKQRYLMIYKIHIINHEKQEERVLFAKIEVNKPLEQLFKKREIVYTFDY